MAFASVLDRHRSLGDQKRDQGAWSEAVEHYSKYLEKRTTDSAIWVQLGNCSKEAGHLDIAENAYVTAIKLNDRDADARLQFGHLMKIQGRKIDALKAYEAVLALQPAHPDIRHEIASLLGENVIGEGSVFSSLGVSAKSLDELLLKLKNNPTRSDIFKRYFAEFLPS